MNTPIVILVILLLCGGVLLLLILWAERRRRLAFLGRPAPTFEEWFDVHLEGRNGIVKEFSTILLTELGDAVGICPTQFLPSDRVSEELSSFVVLDDDVDAVVEEVLLNFGQSKGIEISWDDRWSTLGEIICGVTSQVSSKKQQGVVVPVQSKE